VRLKEEISRLITDKRKDHLQEQTQSKKQLTELNSKIEKLEQRFIEGELTKELFEKYESKYKADKAALEQKSLNW
jgi:site-specific DNA recombinase